ncbi:DUF4397 domain-containing protein [Clostridium thermarum]|uniref:DUF4397 domain-containing protein n=2 Tax=Clostridium thermarum TaxID=1716543 RepID=UPI001120836F|nr:DUF4397 domain-containing protein [Clostridium thermarum]
MFYCPYQNFMREAVPKALPTYYRLLNAMPDAPAIDVYINGKLTASNLRYANFTNYFQTPGGIYEIKVYPAGKKTPILIETNLQLMPNSIHTIAAVPNGDGSLLPILEPLSGPTPGYSMVRFAHLSSEAPAVDIILPDGKILFSDVEFKEVTGYIPVPAGNYTIQAKISETNNIILIVPNIKLQPNKIYTVYVVGKPQGTPPLQVLIPLDGSTYLRDDHIGY